MKNIIEAAKSDPGLARLLDEVREYASVYVLARQRQKGCDGMGELATMKEEFRDAVDKVIQYSQEKKYRGSGSEEKSTGICRVLVQHPACKEGSP